MTKQLRQKRGVGYGGGGGYTSAHTGLANDMETVKTANVASAGAASAPRKEKTGWKVHSRSKRVAGRTSKERPTAAVRGEAVATDGRSNRIRKSPAVVCWPNDPPPLRSPFAQGTEVKDSKRQNRIPCAKKAPMSCDSQASGPSGVVPMGGEGGRPPFQ